MKAIFIIVPLVMLTSCASSEEKYQPAKNGPSSSMPIYSVDSSGNMRRDHRMEKVRDRGCVDNSTNCGTPFGW